LPFSHWVGRSAKAGKISKKRKQLKGKEDELFMDHVLEAMEPHYEVTLEWFVEEHKTKRHKKLSENLYYDELKALIDAMNIIRKQLDWDTLKLLEVVKARLK